MGNPREKLKCPELPPGRDEVSINISILLYCKGDLDGIYLNWEAGRGGHDVLYVPNVDRWRREKPTWARDKRDEIVARILDLSERRGWKFVPREY